MAKAARRRAPAPNRTRTRQADQNLPGDDREPPGGGSSVSTGLAPRGRGRNPLGFLRRLRPRFAADVVSELRKVTWPSFSETRYLTIVVAIVSLAVGAFLGGLDLVFGAVIERLFF